MEMAGFLWAFFLFGMEIFEKSFDFLQYLCYNGKADILQQKRNGGMKMRLWKKVLAAATAGMLCLGSVGASGVQSVLESVGTVLSVSAIVPKIYNNTYDNLYYSVTDADEIAIVGCNTDVVSVEVPKEIDGKKCDKNWQ